MKFLILRRISQILILGLFFASNYYGVKILQNALPIYSCKTANGSLSGRTLKSKEELRLPCKILTP